MRVWSYGDSHAAGHELGTIHQRDLGESFLNSLGFYKDSSNPARRIARHKLGIDQYNKLVKEKWYNHINNVCTPELSYAGEFSKLLGYEFINRAEPGSSNSLNIYKLYQDLDKFENDDLILFSVVTPFRFIPGSDINKTNHQVHWLPDSIAKTLWEYGPHEVCFKLQTHGYIHLLKNLPQKTIILKTVDDDVSVNEINPSFDLSLSFSGHVGTYSSNIDDLRYPGGHFHESCHKKFAEFIYESWNK